MSSVTKGRQFQAIVRAALADRFGEPFEDEVLLPIGTPPKLHAFDLASRSRHVVCECKAYTWTAGGNVPSAKISNLREAATYLSLLKPDALRVLAVRPSRHPMDLESLAAYFSRLNAHLLEGINITDDPVVRKASAFARGIIGAGCQI